MFPPPPRAEAKLNIKTPIEELIEAIHDEDEACRLKLTAEATQRRTALSTRKPTPESLPALGPVLPVALQPTEATTGFNFTTVSKFVPNPTKPANVDPSAKERRRRLLELTEQSFPDGKVPDPFTLTWLGLSQDVARQ